MRYIEAENLHEYIAERHRDSGMSVAAFGDFIGSGRINAYKIMKGTKGVSQRVREILGIEVVYRTKEKPARKRKP